MRMRAVVRSGCPKGDSVARTQNETIIMMMPASREQDSEPPHPKHLARMLDCWPDGARSSPLPLIGSGDWNDGMTRVGHEGRGESVWLGWSWSSCSRSSRRFARPGRTDLSAQYRREADRLTGMLELAWDGDGRTGIA